MSQKPTIECRPNGPYLVRELAELRSASGELVPTKPVLALCRCGGSGSKPFCDGTHQKNGFSDARLGGGPEDKRETYAGRAITLHDNRALCSHAGHCTESLPAVFKYGAEPWIDPDGANAQAIIDIVRRCPSGALAYSMGGAEPADPQRAAAITVTRDGPYAVTGGVRLVNQAFGAGASTEHYTLCRCGGSKRKPFCDGSHWSLGFKDDAGA